MAEAREVWITGIGLVTCLGESLEAHWQGLSALSTADTTSLAPYVIHHPAAIDFDKQIPKKGDQRQMEPWQRLGVYAAGLALDSAGAKGNTELLSKMDMIVAAGGGERDGKVDISILDGLRHAENPGAYLNQRLMSDLRPTLFLAQLSNLMAGNISIVHGVTGSSRTFMGEEPAGVDATRIALARIQAGQSDLGLVGGAYNSERPDVILYFALARALMHDHHSHVWERAAAGGGMEIGTIAAFLVLEEKQHALNRGAKPFARLSSIESDRVQRKPGAITDTLERMWSRVAGRVQPQNAAVISGASGLEPITTEERAFLQRHADLAVRATGAHLGHGLEPQFPANIALAAMSLQRGQLFPTGDPTGFERPMDKALRQVVVTSIGHRRGEGLALVEAVG
ncbi:MAG: 3-oxoacyl-[acyl-carrier-protein] synthase [Hyphomicrobiales bacterium]|jgi:3-oxoacyl-[acyl-carrier-protein] synthase II|nr:3-oxoacyl-[acyl-carrier-protein] synthase [Hyphomicrobiales bacterium]